MEKVRAARRPRLLSCRSTFSSLSLFAAHASDLRFARRGTFDIGQGGSTSVWRAVTFQPRVSQTTYKVLSAAPCANANLPRELFLRRALYQPGLPRPALRGSTPSSIPRPPRA